MDFIQIRGLMTVAPFLDDPENVRMVFKKLENAFEDLKDRTPGAAAAGHWSTPPNTMGATGMRTSCSVARGGAGDALQPSTASSRSARTNRRAPAGSLTRSDGGAVQWTAHPTDRGNDVYGESHYVLDFS